MAKLITSKEAAERIGIAEQTLRLWRWRKFGPPYLKTGRSGRSIQYDLDDVNGWIAAHQRKVENNG